MLETSVQEKIVLSVLTCIKGLVPLYTYVTERETRMSTA